MQPNYDQESDAIYVKVKSGKVYESIEFNSNILIDVSSKDGSIVGIEIIDASSFISKLFGRKISRSSISAWISREWLM